MIDVTVACPVDMIINMLIGNMFFLFSQILL